MWHYPTMEGHGTKSRILLVDDEPDLRTIARLTLEHLGGFDVVEASSGAEAIAKAASLRPAIVLLDVMMPVMDGTEVFRGLQEDPSTRALPVIFLTAKAMPEELQRLRAMGARAILTKPFNPAALVALVRQVLDTRSAPAPGDAGSDVVAIPAQPSTPVDADAEALEALWGLPGEAQPDLLGELIELFAARTPEILRGIRDHVGIGATPEAERLAHSLKGSALTLGARGIAGLARTMERLAGEGRTEEILPLLDRADALLEPTIHRLRAGRDRLAGNA